MVGHGHRLGESFGFIVNAARADRIDVAPVFFALRPHQRIAVNFRRRSEQIDRAFGLCQAERVMGAQGADFQSRNRQFQIIHRTRRRGEMQDIVQRLRHFDIAADVVIDEAKARIFEKGADVLVGAGRIVVHAQHFVPLIEKTLAQVRADEAGAAGN